MHQEPHLPDSGQIESTLKEVLKPLEDSAATAYHAIRQETCHLVSSASESIRRNPVPAVVGAAVFGAAVCYLILSGRHEATFKERYVSEPLEDASDSLRTSMRSLYDNLKFW